MSDIKRRVETRRIQATQTRGTFNGPADRRTENEREEREKARKNTIFVVASFLRSAAHGCVRSKESSPDGLSATTMTSACVSSFLPPRLNRPPRPAVDFFFCGLEVRRRVECPKRPLDR
jgi:hypothetical protein